MITQTELERLQAIRVTEAIERKARNRKRYQRRYARIFNQGKGPVLWEIKLHNKRVDQRRKHSEEHKL